MGKESRKRTLKPNEAKCELNRIRTSAQKLNLVAQLIRGKKVNDALTQLTFSNKRVAVQVKKALQSAIANAENNHQLDVDSLIVSEAWVSKSMVLKRWRPGARGRVGKILKPFSNITIIVREEKEAA